MKRKTPQEKKDFSYERDRRNCYGESPHAARKSIPLRKALRNRANRHKQNHQLNITGNSVSEELADQLESQIHHHAPEEWKKFPDAPLREIVDKKLEEREIMRTQGGRRALRTISKPKEEEEMLTITLSKSERTEGR
jgi:hypothetical protein